MSFLKSSRPSYRLQLPLSKKRVDYHPFTLRAERTLMLASMSGDPAEITDAVINVLNDHVSTESFKAEELPSCEAELLLLNLRAKSVGETLDLQVNDPDQDIAHPLSVDLTDISITTDEGYSDQITVGDDITLFFQLPGLRGMENVEEDSNEFDTSIKIITGCLKSIVQGDECYQAADLKQEEVEEFLLDLTSGDFNKIVQDFLLKMPKLSHSVKVEREDGSSFEAEISGLASFL